jgi:hypothetical protein
MQGICSDASVTGLKVNIAEVKSISPEAIIGGGTIKGRIGDFWQARKEYGKVKDFIKF